MSITLIKRFVLISLIFTQSHCIALISCCRRSSEQRRQRRVLYLHTKRLVGRSGWGNLSSRRTERTAAASN